MTLHGQTLWKLETMSLYEPMDTDHRQTLLGLNQDKEGDRLISDFMNHKVSPNALAESRELVKLGNALECLKDMLRSTSITTKLWLRFMDYIEIIKDVICCDRLGMQCPTALFSGQRVGLKWGRWHQLWWNRESRQWDTMSEMQP